MKNDAHREIQEKLLTKLLLIMGIIAIPSLLFSLFRFFDIGWHLSFSIQIVVVSIVILFAIYRKSIFFHVKIIYLIVICFILSISASLDLGLSGFLVEYLLLAVFIGVIFWGKKQALFIYFAGAAIILVIGILTVNGIISPTTNIDTYIKNYSSWLSVLTSFLFITALVIIIAGEIGHLLFEKMTELQQKNNELQIANDEIRKLQGILPICVKCKKIRDSDGYWEQVETYIANHFDAQFSHGLCIECSDELYGDHEWYQKSKLKKK